MEETLGILKSWLALLLSECLNTPPAEKSWWVVKVKLLPTMQVYPYVQVESRDLRLIFRTSQECALLLPKSNSTVEVKKVLCGTAWGAFLPCSSALPED